VLLIISNGYNKNNFLFPIGGKAELDADNFTIKLIEKAVN
jgi:hypothetical protein